MRVVVLYTAFSGSFGGFLLPSDLGLYLQHGRAFNL